MNCSTCRYSMLSDVNAQLKRLRFCKRFPPTPVLIPTARGVQVTPMFPAVTDTEYCGEYTYAGPGLQDPGHPV